MTDILLNKTGSGLLSSVDLHARIIFLYTPAHTGHDSKIQTWTSRIWLAKELSSLRNFMIVLSRIYTQ